MKSSILTKSYKINRAIPFSKYTGCGNDFIIIDDRQSIYPKDRQDLVERLCDRQYGVGADGVILLGNSSSADYLMRIFNPDGSEAEMCGNGMRCLGKFIRDMGIPDTAFNIEVMGKVYPLTLHDDGSVSVVMPPPEDVLWDIELLIDGNRFRLDTLNTGVPHALLEVSELMAFDLESLGPKVRYHSFFEPQGTNFNLYQISSRSPSLIRMRTYERGVERETKACGTGATACALTAWKKENLTNPIHVSFASGEFLEFNIAGIGGKVDHILMKGPAEFVFRGDFSI